MSKLAHSNDHTMLVMECRNQPELAAFEITGLRAQIAELRASHIKAKDARIERLEKALAPPVGFDFTISRDRGKWTVALWTIGAPGGGRHCHGIGENLDDAWAIARAALEASHD